MTHQRMVCAADLEAFFVSDIGRLLYPKAIIESKRAESLSLCPCAILAPLNQEEKMNITVTSKNETRSSADLLVVGLFEKEKNSKELQSLDRFFAKTVKAAIDKARFEGKMGQTFSSFHDDTKEASEVLAVGLGLKKNYRSGCLRKAAAQIFQQAKTRQAKRIRIVLDTFIPSGLKAADTAAAFAEVFTLAEYQFDRYKSKTKAKKNIRLELLLLSGKPKADFYKKVESAEAIAEGVLRCRDLINEPGNIMNADKMSKLAREMASKKKLSCKIIGPAELKRLKMGGILGVNQGSPTPPALIVLEHGQRYKSKGTVCLVGKGVTFDTGGISIKPARDMEKMKYDMSGAAAVIGTMGVLADLKLPVHVVGLVPAVENNVAVDPQRPGDIIRMYNGKSVEVINTDAEGRLILADALSYSAKYKPKAIIDLATLTGLVVYTFGDKAIGLMGNNEKLIGKVKKAGEETGERCWELPMWAEYGDQIKGHHSDLLNVGGAYGGTITAAKFLEEFVPEKTAWVHLDIAGTAWTDGNRADCPKGATGVGVRLLTEFISSWK